MRALSLTVLPCIAVAFGLGVLFPALSQAAIHRVNNVATLATNCATCHQTLASAIAASSNGDTIHLEPSDVNYMNATIDKQLVIIGAGFMLGNAGSENAGLQADSRSSTVHLITLNAGSEGTVITGLHFFGGGGGLTINSTANILIRRNFFDGTLIRFNTGAVVPNMEIAENYLHGIYGGSSANVFTNMTIRNNYIEGYLNLAGANFIVTNMVVANNTLNYNGNHQIKNAEVANNVFYQGGVVDNNNTIHDNISAAALPPGTNNTVVSMGDVYDLTLGSDDGKWDILSSSLYDEAGSNPLGMFSGISPYRLSGVPNVPAIYGLHSTLNTNPGGMVNVTLSTRSNN